MHRAVYLTTDQRDLDCIVKSEVKQYKQKTADGLWGTE